MIIDTKHSFIGKALCHHPERISCKITETWKLQPVFSLTLENPSTPAMSNPRSACGPVDSFVRRNKFSITAYVQYNEPDFTFIISNSTFSMQ